MGLFVALLDKLAFGGGAEVGELGVKVVMSAGESWVVAGWGLLNGVII